MPWNWGDHKATWPSYESAYLAKRLGDKPDNNLLEAIDKRQYGLGNLREAV